jgi:hypothetical protein
MHATAAAERGALAGHVGSGGLARAEQPLRHPCVQRSGHRVLEHRVGSGEKGAHLEVRRAARRVSADEPDRHVQFGRLTHGQHRRGVRQQERDPFRAVVRPLSFGDQLTVEPQLAGGPRDDRLLDGPGGNQRRCRESEPLLVVLDRDQAGAALLDDEAVTCRRAACGQPGVAGAKRRVAREREFLRGGEDPDAVVGILCGGRQHERGFRKVGPVRDALHLLAGQALGAEDHRDGVALVGKIGEHVNLAERAHDAHAIKPSRALFAAGLALALVRR